MEAIVAIILGEEELEVCLRILDVSDLIILVDEVANDRSAKLLIEKMTCLPQALQVSSEYRVLWKTGIKAIEHIGGCDVEAGLP